MRDLALTLFIVALIPVILKFPWTGVLVSAWISLFSPHRFAFGFAYDFPFAMIVALTTFVGMLAHWKEVRLPVNSLTVLLMALLLWMTVTTLFALEPDDAYVQWKRVMKVLVFVLVSASLIRSRKQLEGLVWVLVLSVGFFGVKGGAFTLLTGGASKVYGPPGGSFISDNNAISVALVMTIPLMLYLTTIVASQWLKWGLYAAMALSVVAVLGTHSRGAMLATAGMLVFLWIKSHRKVILGFLLCLFIPVAIGLMPEIWKDRMKSIESYEGDQSAMGRLNSWAMAVNVANDRPLVGGGFELYSSRTFAKYAPNPNDIHTAHSVYFQMLGEHGYIGLALFLSLAVVSWRLARRVIRESRDRPDLAWASGLARAIQASLVGFAIGGAFVNIAYWEVPYYEIVILMIASRVIDSLRTKPGPVATDNPRSLAGAGTPR